MKGKVKRWLDRAGYGFIHGEDGNEYFAHFSQISFDCTGRKSLRNGETVTFDPAKGMSGDLAVNIRRGLI